MQTRRTFLSSLAVAGAAAVVPFDWASGPADVLLIRHAEEPEHGPSLNAKGQERARALIKLFPSRFPKPTAIFATKTTKESARPVETVTPLAKALGLSINQEFGDAQYGALASDILHASSLARGHVLVCWHQGTLPELAKMLGVENPPGWSSSRYDRLWIVRFTGGRVQFTEEPQRLLPGDSDAGLF